MLDLTKEIDFLVENWESIGDEFKSTIKTDPEQKVIVLLDRQKPSVEADYSFDEERITVNQKGQVIWGFDSGCSCPAPWHDSAPECYSCDEGWKEFELNIQQFDHGAVEECLDVINRIKEKINV